MSDDKVVPIAARIEKRDLEAFTAELAEELQKNHLPDDCYFALFVYRKAGGGAMKYLSSGAIDDVMQVIARWRAKITGSPQPGERRYSAFFGGNVVLVEYIDDKTWWFRLEHYPEKGKTRAKTPWSQMPPERKP